MSIDEIKKVVIDFKNATERALKAGFKVFEIHAAHGYLLNEFLSPLSNHRQDEYGGIFENRIKFLMDIVEAMRKIITDQLPLFVRISASDWMENGWDIDDSVKLAKILKEKSVDLVDCSSGGNSHEQKIPALPLYQVPFAERIKKETGILTGAVGLITTRRNQNKFLRRVKQT